MKKKFLSLALTFAMVLAMVPATTLKADAAVLQNYWSDESLYD